MKLLYKITLVLVFINSCTNNNCDSEFKSHYLSCLNTISDFNNYTGDLSNNQIKNLIYSIEFLEKSTSITSHFAWSMPPGYNQESWIQDSVIYMNWIKTNECKYSKDFTDSLRMELTNKWNKEFDID